MHASDVTLVMALFSAAGIDVWIGGGWGVDALVGRPTRDHADLDLVFNRALESEVIGTLASEGFHETLDWRPGRFVMSDGNRDLDLHPLEVRSDGSAVLHTHDGRHFDYATDDFASGTIGGCPVPCLSASLQWTFHQGYEPGPNDLHDLAQLEQLLGG